MLMKFLTKELSMTEPTDREMALRAIAWCDQIEEALARGDENMIAAGKEFIIQWAENLTDADVRVQVQCIRAMSLEILREEDGRANSEDD